MYQIAQICTFFKNFPGVIHPDPQNWGGVKPLPQTHPPQQAPTVSLFQSFRSRWVMGRFRLRGGPFWM